MGISIVNASLMATTENGFTKAMREVFTGGYWSCPPGKTTFNQDLIKLVQEKLPNVVFLQIQAPGIISVETAQEIAKHSFVINFSGDIRIESPPKWYIEIGKVIGLSLFTNMKDVRGCWEQGVKSEWMEMGYDPERFRKWEVPSLAPAIVAHFNDYGAGYFPLSGYRQQIVEKLTTVFGNDFGVYGNMKGARGNFNDDQIAESKNYCGAKIAINCSHFFCEKYSSDRLLRILGSGTACVSHHFPDIHSIHTPGEHLYTFTSLDEMVTICNKLLSDDKERERVAKAGQQHVLNNYTFRHMAENLKNLYLKYEKEQLSKT